MKSRIFVDSPEALERAFRELIPISEAIGVKVVSYDQGELVISAPLSKNINHQHSAFGGSLFSVAALAGWGLMQLKLSELELDCNTVVMGGEVKYSRPVYDDLVCHCRLPENADEIFKTLEEQHTVTTSMTSTYYCNEKVAMQLEGQYHLKLRS